MTTSITTLIRNLRVGDRLSFDDGRITIALEDKSGRAARLRLTLSEDVVVDKPNCALASTESEVAGRHLQASAV